MELISKKWSQFGLWAETRPHEVGVASNPESACRGECVPGGKIDDWGEVVTR